MVLGAQMELLMTEHVQASSISSVFLIADILFINLKEI